MMFLLVWMAGRYDETRDLCLAVSFGSSVASAARVIQSVYNLGAANANDNLANGRQSREKGAVVIEMTAAEFRGRQQEPRKRSTQPNDVKSCEGS